MQTGQGATAASRSDGIEAQTEEAAEYGGS